MDSSRVFSQILLWVVLAGGNQPQPNCGHVQELSRGTLKPSKDIFIYSGPYFYHYDLKSEELKGRYSMEAYYKGVPTEMEGATLHDGPSVTAMLFIQGKTVYTYRYNKTAFASSQNVLDNMDNRMNLTQVQMVSDMKSTFHEGQAYCSRVKIVDKKLSMCKDKKLYNCGADLESANPVENCNPNEQVKKKYTENCRGITTAELDGQLFLVLSDDKDLLLFRMNENADLTSKPHKRLSLSTIFSCESSTVVVVIALLTAAVVFAVVLNVAIIAIWIRKRRKAGLKLAVAQTMDENDSTTVVTAKRVQKAAKK